MDKPTHPTFDATPIQTRPRSAAASARSRGQLENESVADKSSTESVVHSGGQAIEADGDDLRRASSGNVQGVDDDSARQRLRDCQSSLVSLGYHVGHGDDPADGISGFFDAPTGEAVRAFQDDNDLDVTGKIDRETYEALMQGFEQAMDMRAGGEAADGFLDVQGEQPFHDDFGGRRRPRDVEPLDDSDATLLELQDELDAGTAPPELEDL